LGVACVIAKSYARIFFRNSFNNGLLLLENEHLYDEIKEGDTITVKDGEVVANGKSYPVPAIPQNLMEILEAGGLVKAMQKRNGIA
jgi:3-isopropylmalate/(R)-2-methylmalate dehydratase small subunit